MMQGDIANNILKSNTSIVGIVCKDGIVLGADRRGTAGTIVMEKNVVKIQKVNNYIAAAYTGGVADLQLSHKVLAAELRLKELRARSRSTVKEAASLLAMMVYRNIRTPTMIPNIVGTLIAGVDENNKSELYTIEPAGGIRKVDDYDANFSSGMPYILGLLERQYKKDLTVKEAVELTKECLKSSTQRDVGSGNGIDVFTITKEGIKHVVSEEIVAEYR
ncbi:MAG TPA: proteasome subunit beta [Candidatus Nanoarchaeia archaeon]|nr:proteasome subunit beta [Candidatus Nanoarchaeia archaeon]